MRRIKEVLHTIVSTIVNVITLPFRALAKLFRPRR
ncbi:MAG: LPFR motif small protein [Sciscionella sp.]